jgi:alkylation response protein AidB-like acyl-CoA dehydrogenase
MIDAYRLDDFNVLQDDEFRALVRAFLTEHHPPELRNPLKRLHRAEAQPWYDVLSRAGWVAPAWPREYGGMGLSAAKQLIYMDEFERFGAARVPDHGIVLLGPLLIRHGTDAQKAQFLPKIIAGEHIWCQGYSEPSSGSDLASLRTEAVLDGGEWVINGQKIWTTLAGDADWMFMLVRTNRQAKKQAGISFLLVPMNSVGVKVRPIQNLDLHDEFSEVFFDDVRVPQGNLVGEVNAGWSIAKALLGFERIFLGSPRQAAYALARLRQLAVRAGLMDHPRFLDVYTQLRLDLADHETLFEKMAEALRCGATLGPEVSFLKLHQTELFQRITDVMLDIAAEEGGLLHPLDNVRELNPMGLFLVARAATIYGGSSEIQRNIIAKTVLGLPT